MNAQGKVNFKYYQQLKSLFNNITEEQLKQIKSNKLTETFRLYTECNNKIIECKTISKKYGTDIEILLNEYFCA